MTAAAERAGLPRGSGRRALALDPCALGRLAAGALRAEAELTPKPGLVDRRGPGAHHDMDLAMFLRSAAVLEPWFATLARAAARAPGTPGAALRLRRDLGRIGRRAEAEMLAATGGVNTHRGALYSLGFLVAGAAYAGACAPAEVALAAGELARLPDIAVRQARSHGDLVRDQHPRAGAAVHAATGFPVTMRTALPALRASRRRGAGEQVARLDALLAVMAVLDDTCVLYRAGTQGLGLIRRDAAAVLAAGGAASPAGRRQLDRLDRSCRTRRLSPGGAADVLATAMFLDQLDRYGHNGDTTETRMQTLNLEYRAAHSAAGRAHVGVVGSGDLEILFEPGTDQTASVRVRTTVDGFDVVWRRVLDAFFAHHPVAGRYELNDFGATPGIVSLRLEQVLQISRKPASQERKGQ